ncbi:MAG: o-succinylbenzoate--CoA ligase [Rhodothermia bacterium]|nr:MAG: o-succinylbenzoate--CoA ligase [Rhodothermia bacterium]
MPEPYPLTYSTLAESDQIECPIRFHARTTPEHVAIRALGKAISYEALDQAVLRASARLKFESSTRRMAICLEEPIDTIVWIFAALRASAEIFLLSRRLPRSARAKSCSDSGARMVVSDEGFDLKDGIWIDPSNSDENSFAPDAESQLTLDAPATLIHTSGTAGASKIAVHSLRNYFSSALSSNSRIVVAPSSRWLLSLPLDHVAGLGILFRTFVAGGTVALQHNQQSTGDAIDLTKSTHVSLVPTQLQRLLDDKPYAPTFLKEALVGGGPTHSSLIRRAIEGGYPVRTTYGMTEMSSQIATSDIWTEIRDGYSSGRALPLVELKLDAEDEILVRGPAAFLGYLDPGGSLRRRAHRGEDSWIRTGDIGCLDGEELVVIGRRDQMFVSGGENIQPEEIERALLELDQVEMAIVVPVSDVEFGFRPVAFIRSIDPAFDEESLIEQLKESLASFKIPNRFLDWPEGLDSQSMKIDRQLLTEMAASL